MPNKEAKNRKRNKIKLNAQLRSLGRTANQVKRKRAKEALRQSKEPNTGVKHGR